MQIMDLWTDVNTVAADDTENSLDALKDQARAILREKPEQLSDQLVNDYLKVLAAEDVAHMDKEARAAYMEAAAARAERARRSSAAAADFVDAEEADEAAIMYNMQAGTLDILTAALEEIARFRRSNVWRHYCKMLPDAAERIRTLNIKHGGILDVLHTLDTCRKLDKAAPFADSVVDAWKKSHDGDTPQFTTFYFDLLPDCLDIANGKKDIKSLCAVVPRTFYSFNSTVMNKLSTVPTDKKKYPVNVGGGGKKAITVGVSLIPNGAEITGGAFTPYDHIVFDAWCTLLKAGNRAATDDMIYRAINGKSDTKYVSAAAARKVHESIEKQRVMTVMIDTREQQKKWLKGKNDIKAYYKGYLLPIEYAIAEINGETRYAYIPLKYPCLAQYTEDVGQIIEVDPELLDVKKVLRSGKASETVSLRKSETRTVITYFLARQLDVIHETGNNRILAESLYTECGINRNNRAAKQDAREWTFAVLDYYKAKGFIKDYKHDGDSARRKPVTYIDIMLSAYKPHKTYRKQQRKPEAQEAAAKQKAPETKKIPEAPEARNHTRGVTSGSDTGRKAHDVRGGGVPGTTACYRTTDPRSDRAAAGSRAGRIAWN